MLKLSVVQQSDGSLKRWSISRSLLDRLKRRISSLDRVPVSPSQPIQCIPAKTPALPPGFQLYASGLRIDGLHSRRAAAQDFARCSVIAIELEVDAKNPEPGALIKVIGVSKLKRYFVGYVPHATSARLAESGLISDVRAQLEYISQDSEGVTAIVVQLMLPEAIDKDNCASGSDPARLVNAYPCQAPAENNAFGA